MKFNSLFYDYVNSVNALSLSNLKNPKFSKIPSDMHILEEAFFFSTVLVDTLVIRDCRIHVWCSLGVVC